MCYDCNDENNSNDCGCNNKQTTILNINLNYLIKNNQMCFKKIYPS